ncbi:MAG: 4-hydroxybenzoate octaprenyltransferase [Pseudomonadota bacterium]
MSGKENIISTAPAPAADSKLSAYLALTRLDRPVGTLLLLWPTLGALWVAAGEQPPALYIAIFAAGTLLMRSAGCVANDMADRNFDPHVTRTQARPLATGALTVSEAAVLLVILLLASAATLFYLNNLTRLLALAAVPIALTYPLFKRFTYLPQVPLGAAFSWGILMAYGQMRGTVPSEAALLFIGSLFWIVAYDTAYAMADREDDLRIGVKSTAILFGSADRLAIGVLQAIALGIFYLYGQQAGLPLFFNIALAVIVGLFVYQQRLLRRRQPDECFAAFKNNIWVGFMLFLGMAFDVHFADQLAGLHGDLPGS